MITKQTVTLQCLRCKNIKTVASTAEWTEYDMIDCRHCKMLIPDNEWNMKVTNVVEFDVSIGHDAFHTEVLK